MQGAEAPGAKEGEAIRAPLGELRASLGELRPELDATRAPLAQTLGGEQFDAAAVEAFYRVSEADSGESRSLGLGLALVQRIAHAHGGRAWAENVVAGGARVSFSVAV